MVGFRCIFGNNVFKVIVLLDEIILSVKLKSKKNSQLQNFQKITQIVINKATADLPKALRNPPFINFEEIRSINVNHIFLFLFINPIKFQF